MAQFKKAMRVTEEELLWQLKDLTQSQLAAHEVVRKVFEQRHEFHPSGELLLLDSFAPWKSALFDVEKQADCVGQVKFVLFADGASWRVSTVPPHTGSFAMRVPLKAEWRGLREKELGLASGCSDAIFVHASGFIGGARSKDSVIKMAEESLRVH